MIRHMLLTEENNIGTFTVTPTSRTIDIDISDEKFNEMTEIGYAHYKYINGEIVYDSSKIDKDALIQELSEIKEWFSTTDYIPNKIVTGEWETTDERWLNYLSERTIKRNRQDEINAILNQ